MDNYYFFKYWYDEILDDIFFKILRQQYVRSIRVNLLNLQPGSWHHDNLIENK
jgi:hypothetical protein